MQLAWDLIAELRDPNIYPWLVEAPAVMNDVGISAPAIAPIDDWLRREGNCSFHFIFNSLSVILNIGEIGRAHV